MNLDHIFIAPKNWDKSVAFYRDVLNFKIVSQWGEKLHERGAVLKNSAGAMVVIAEEHEDIGDSAWQHGINGNRPTVHFNVKNVDQFFETLPKGEHVLTAPENTHWNTRWCVLKDPDNNIIAVNQNRE